VNDLSFDCVVAGGGPVGWACALAAQASLGKRARVAVVEREPLPVSQSNALLSARVYTVASGNLRWLTEQGVQFDLARTATVTDIVVSGRDGQQSMHVSANDAGEAQLASVFEHETLTHAIATRAQALGVQLICGAVSTLHDLDGQKLLELTDRRMLQARVVIAADGMQSKLRDLSGISATVRPYPQHGVVAHLRCDHPHRGAARQWFLPDGSILALLPLPDVHGSAAVSMVWSVTEARADELCALSEADLLHAVNAASLDAAAVNHVVSGTQQFPLTLVRVANPVAQRLVVVGDAAHAVHPLAGQGVNLGLVDARALHEVWQHADKVGFDPGHALLLGRYRRERFGPTLAMQLATDGLFRLYNQTDRSLLMAAGDAGMRLLSRLPAFRRSLSTAAVQ
jgi:2-polyprenylphenol 6-hydroxylase